MTTKVNLSQKGKQIDKATTLMIAAVAAASFIAIFSFVATRALLNKKAFQSRVITAKEKARDQLKENIVAVESLKDKYFDFSASNPNMLDGNPIGTGDRDGDNAKIILDALPSKYDFPGMVTGLEKLVSPYQSVTILATTDDEIIHSKDSTSTIKPVEITISTSIIADLEKNLEFLQTLDRSIRPIHLFTMTLNTVGSNITLEVTGKTYYQPATVYTIGSEEIK